MAKKKKGRKLPFDLTANLDKRRYKRELKQATREEFGPLERATQQELGASNARVMAIPQWFQDYQNQLQGSANASSAAYAGAQQSLSARMAEAGASDTGARAQMLEAAQADAAKRGVAYDDSGAQAHTAAASSRNALQARAAGAIATQGANQASYLADKKRIGSGEQAQQLSGEYNRYGGILSDQREIAKAKGEFRNEFRRMAREAERKWLLENKALAGTNKRAKLSSQTSIANSKRSSATSIANSKRSSKTSRANSKRGQKGQNARQEDQQKAQAKRDRQENKGKGKGKGKGKL